MDPKTPAAHAHHHHHKHDPPPPADHHFRFDYGLYYYLFGEAIGVNATWMRRIAVADWIWHATLILISLFEEYKFAILTDAPVLFTVLVLMHNVFTTVSLTLAKESRLFDQGEVLLTLYIVAFFPTAIKQLWDHKAECDSDSYALWLCRTVDVTNIDEACVPASSNVCPATSGARARYNALYGFMIVTVLYQLISTLVKQYLHWRFRGQHTHHHHKIHKHKKTHGIKVEGLKAHRDGHHPPHGGAGNAGRSTLFGTLRQRTALVDAKDSGEMVPLTDAAEYSDGEEGANNPRLHAVNTG